MVELIVNYFLTLLFCNNGVLRQHFSMRHVNFNINQKYAKDYKDLPLKMWPV